MAGQRVMLLLDARHGFKKADIEFLERLYDPKGPSPLGTWGSQQRKLAVLGYRLH